MHTISVVSAAGGMISVSVDDELVAERVGLPETGGYEVWTSTVVGSIPLDSGRRRLRIQVEEGGFNLKSILLDREE